MATKLKDLKISKVDFVDEGANQKADINLFKRKEPEEEEKPQESLFKRFVGWLRGEGMDEEAIAKAMSFTDQMLVRSSEQIENEMYNVTMALRSSLYSILMDTEMDETAKQAAMNESVSQFTAAMNEYVQKWCSGQTAIAKNADKDPVEEMCVDHAHINDLIEKLKKADDDDDDDIDENEVFDDDDDDDSNVKKGELEEMQKIDKSKMTPEEVTAYEEIVKKYAVDEPDETTAEDETVEKAKETAAEEPVESEIVKALKAQIEETRKTLNAMKDEALTKEVTEVAKKYVSLGKKVEDLVPVLKKMKAGGEELYNDYVALLDQQLDIQKNSGVFTEFGKSTTGDATGSPEKMWITKAKELMKSKPDLTIQQAMDEVALTDDELRAQIDQ